MKGELNNISLIYSLKAKFEKISKLKEKSHSTIAGDSRSHSNFNERELFIIRNLICFLD